MIRTILVYVAAVALAGGGPDAPTTRTVEPPPPVQAVEDHPVDAEGNHDHERHWSWYHTSVLVLTGTVVLTLGGIVVALIKRGGKPDV